MRPMAGIGRTVARELRPFDAPDRVGPLSHLEGGMRRMANPEFGDRPKWGAYAEIVRAYGGDPSHVTSGTLTADEVEPARDTTYATTISNTW